jgi:hypothetical protein
MNKKIVDLEIIDFSGCTGEEGFEDNPEEEPIADCDYMLKKDETIIAISAMESNYFYPELKRRLLNRELKPMLLNKKVRVEIVCVAKDNTGFSLEKKKIVDYNRSYYPYIEGEVVDTYQKKYSSRKGISKNGEEGYYRIEDDGFYGKSERFIEKDDISEDFLEQRIIEMMIVDCGVPITVHNDKNYKLGDWVFVECKVILAKNYGIVK